MKSVRSILSIVFACLVVVSCSSFLVGIHFCRGEVKNMALFTQAEGCEKEKQLPPCHRHIGSPCCEDTTVLHEGDDFKNDISAFSFTAPVAHLVQPAILIAEIIPSSFISTHPFYEYDPPLRSTDLTIDLQIFLI